MVVDLGLVSSSMKQLSTILRLWMMGTELLMMAADVMLMMMLWVHRLGLKCLLVSQTLVQAWRWLHRDAGIESRSVRRSGIVLLEDQLHADQIEFVRLVGVLLRLVGPMVSADSLATAMIFVGLGNDQYDLNVLGLDQPTLISQYNRSRCS